MASESTEEGAVTVELPPALDEWLDERATALGVEPETVVSQLLAAYRTTSELDGEPSLSDLFDVEGAVEDAMQDELDAAVAAAVDDALDDRVEAVAQSAMRERLPDITDAVEGRLDARFDTIEEDFQGKIEDVRERVIQLKRTADGKAAADHDHAAFDRIDDLGDEITALNRELVEVRDEVENGLGEQSEQIDGVEDRVTDIDDRLDDVEDKLKRVAWVVSDLRDDQGGRDAHQQAVDRIKRAAAQEGISKATCQNCGETVEIGLLTDPQCPHCDSTVSDVRPEGGIFRPKAKLITAAQLEAGPSDE